VRRQSEATTALWLSKSENIQSGVALRATALHKTAPVHPSRITLWNNDK